MLVLKPQDLTNITVVVIMWLNRYTVRPTSLEDEAIAMLHAISLKRVIGFFIQAVEQVWRGAVSSILRCKEITTS